MILTSCIRVFYLSSEMPSDKTKMNTLKIISRFLKYPAQSEILTVFPRKVSVKPPIVRVHNLCLEKLSDNNNNNLLFFTPHFFLFSRHGNNMTI